ncbi:MAG: CDP-alcohol phosphatidyltransferase family protein [Melioribacteraceae bacterium]|nr:CDP-alcohol phosphatidyltransferase family protein [Melioribacteraceae bacterium]
MQIRVKELFNLPNSLSLLRIVLSVPLAYLLMESAGRVTPSIIILAIIVIATDYLDGYFSRKLNQVTDLGKALDPIADKIGMGIVLVAIVVYYNFPLTLVALLIYRDILIMVFGLIINKRTNITVSANFWGKLNTSIYALTAFLYVLGVEGIPLTILLVLSYSTLALSGVTYYLFGERILFVGNKKRYLLRLFIVVLTIAVIVITERITLL